MDSFQTLATFTYPHEFAVLKMMLEEADIQFFFQNETMVGLMPFYSNAFGGIHLKVHRSDVPRAQEIIDELSDNGKLHVVR
jgi:hypothetical protein